jgi:PIN domain nuclease of toxin-antitoxin system
LAKPIDSRPIVLDATAILAVLFSEPGSERLPPLLQRSAVSAVSLSEAYVHLLRSGVKPALAWKSLQELGLEVCPFDVQQAHLAGELVEATSNSRLSLGDRACLALALQRNAVVYTTDAAWKELNAGVDVELIR